MRRYVLSCNYCKYTTPCERGRDDRADGRLDRHQEEHHSCRFCGWWPSNGFGWDHWTRSLARHEAKCKAQIEQCKYCNYKPMKVSKYLRMCEHVFKAHVKPCRLCGWKAASVEVWERERDLHEAFCQQRLQTTIQFLSVDVGLNEDVVGTIVALMLL